MRNDVYLSREKVAERSQIMGLSVSRELLSQIKLGRCSIRVSILLALKQLYQVNSFDELFRDVNLKTNVTEDWFSWYGDYDFNGLNSPSHRPEVVRSRTSKLGQNEARRIFCEIA